MSTTTVGALILSWPINFSQRILLAHFPSTLTFDYHPRSEMRCPQCASTQIQRDYDDARALVRLAGVRKVLCNTCGHVFHGFDPLGRIGRSPGKRIEWSNRRIAPRYTAHLPTAISLVETTSKEGKATYSEPSKGHCDSISSHGMGLSLIGSRFPEQELSRKGRLLFVRVDLPLTTIEAVVSVVNHRRTGEHQRKWFLGVKIQQIGDTDKANLRAYLEQRTREQPVIISD